MTVEELITKLQKMPQDAIVTIRNNSDYFDGEYEVTYIEEHNYPNACAIVHICTDYFYEI